MISTSLIEPATVFGFGRGTNLPSAQASEHLMRCLILLLSLTVYAEDRLRYPLPAESSIDHQVEITYKDNLKFDLYRPKGAGAVPAVIFLNGIGGEFVRKWPIYQQWGQVVTTQGLAGILMDSAEGHVPENFRALLQFLHAHAKELQIDADQLMLWACSANVTAGLPIAMDPSYKELRAAVIYYGTGEVKAFRPDLPVLYARAGLDGVGLNKGIDAILSRALAANAPFTLMNLPASHHAFDARDDNAMTREAIGRTLEFLKSQAQPALQEAISEGLDEAAAVSAAYRSDWAGAIVAYRKLAEKKPQDSEIRRNYGNVLLSEGHYKAALTEFERALAMGNPNVGWISYGAATASIHLDDTEGAMRYIEKLKDIEPMQRKLAGDEAFAKLRTNPRFRQIAGM